MNSAGKFINIFRNLEDITLIIGMRVYYYYYAPQTIVGDEISS